MNWWVLVVRWVLTGVLLVFVWKNAHWSVALFCLFISIANEMNVVLLRMLVRAIRPGELK